MVFLISHLLYYTLYLGIWQNHSIFIRIDVYKIVDKYVTYGTERVKLVTWSGVGLLNRSFAVPFSIFLTIDLALTLQYQTYISYPMKMKENVMIL